MKAMLIDPNARKMTEVKYSGDYRDIYKLIGADTFDVARINDEGDGIYIDDNGLENPVYNFIGIKGYPQPLAGKGLLLGCDVETGKSKEASVSKEWLKANVFWVELLFKNVWGVTPYGKKKPMLLSYDKMIEFLADGKYDLGDAA